MSSVWCHPRGVERPRHGGPRQRIGAMRLTLGQPPARVRAGCYGSPILMTDNYRTTRARIVRQIFAVSLLLTVLVAIPTAGSAAPTKGEIDAAKHKLSSLNYRESQLDEQFNQAQVALQRAQDKLAAARVAARTASTKAARARILLSKRAKAAYEGSGSQ